MSRLLLILILACFSSLTLLAQVTKGRDGSTAVQKSTLTPNPTAGKSPKTNPASQTTPSTNRNTRPPVSQNREGTPSNTSSTTKTTQDRATRPSTYAPPTSTTTTKGNAKGAIQKASPLKSAERGTVNWMTLEQALEKSKTEKRKFFVDMYTDWCGWCKHMDSTTFVNASVAKYLNEHYYPVKFNAEQENDIVFKDKTYKFKKNGSRGYHELAAFWLNNRLSFPTMVFLDENQQLIQPVPGYQDASKMEAIINYFGSDSHKKTPWESYEKNFSNKK